MLFIVGVIYPLHFLPYDYHGIPNIYFQFDIIYRNFLSLHGILLVLISTLFLGIMIMFLNINNKLKHNPEQIKALGYFTTYYFYSNLLSGLDE